MNLPPAAERIADARKKGFRPAAMVIVSMVGLLSDPNPTVYVKHGNYDWWWVRDLYIIIFTDKDKKWRDVAMAIAAHRPRLLSVWDVFHKQGMDVYRLPTLNSIERGPDKWIWELDFLPWLPFQNKEFASYD